NLAFLLSLYTEIQREIFMISIQNSIKQIKSGKIHPLYLLYGTERYFIDQFKSNLMNAVVKESEDDAVITYDLLETPIQDVISDVETIPFFTERKIIIAENATFLKSKPDRLSFTHDLTSLEQYVDYLVEYSILVLIAPYEKIDERKKITKRLKKEAYVIDCNTVKQGRLRPWIHQVANQQQITMTDDASELLEAEFQNQLHLLHNEIEKLALYVGDGGEVTKEIAAN